jgi:hypothetical protein
LAYGQATADEDFGHGEILGTPTDTTDPAGARIEVSLETRWRTTFFTSAHETDARDHEQQRDQALQNVEELTKT